MPSFNKFSNFQQVCTSRKDAIELAKQAERAAAEFANLKKYIEFDLARAAQRRDMTLQGFSGGALESIRGAAQQRWAEDRREVLTKSEEKRYEPLKRLKAAADQAEASLKLFNPLVYALAFELGSHERGRYHDQIKNLPPPALRSLMQKALSERNQVLAAALIGETESRDSDSQSFDSAAAAEQMFGPECREALGALKIAARAFEDTYRSNRELETGKVDGILSISQGLKEKNDPSPALADIESA